MEIRYKNLFENKTKTIKPFDVRIQTLLNEMKINPKIIHNTILSKTVPWTRNQPIEKLEQDYPKPKHTPSLSKRNSSTSKTTSQITTTSIEMDADRMKVGHTAILQNQELLKRLPNESSIYSAEVTVIEPPMNMIAYHKSCKFIIYSNSKSAFQVLQNKNTSTPLITRLLD